ncbi:Glycosyl hydrolase superfamily protein [Abeliophyllum distichum]|uniref:glucan endo-1,3-beta-D-glucosidase n=1 Tax=Abeliophyllum distichum TaxID=126358 RepID=A0ABD1PWS9_9LAMI
MEAFLHRIALLHIFLGFLLTLSGFGSVREVESLGINYGQVGNNLPAPDKVLELLHSLRITKARIYDTNPQVLTAFANSNVELMVTVENQVLSTLMDQQQALQWVGTHIRPYFPATRITGIAVGNELFTGDDLTLINNVVPAMVSIHAALVKLGLDQYIHVTTPNSLAVLAESYPPSAGTFQSELTGIMSQILKFLADTKAPFLINAYPYFAYKDDSNRIPIDYVLFNRNPGMIDPYTKLHYDNMLYAQVDAVIFAMARLGFQGIEVKVSETGWPSRGDPNEIGATVQNAGIYNRNLMRRQLKNEGTPLRPNIRLETYIFALFNEDMKPGPTSERNYGIFQPDGTMVYNVGLSALSTTSSTSTSTSTSTSSASISFTSNANQVKQKGMGYKSLVYSILILYLVVFQVFYEKTDSVNP